MRKESRSILMPPKPDPSLYLGWSALDSPILPFLAPRVFFPRPPCSRRAFFPARVQTRGAHRLKTTSIVCERDPSRRISTQRLRLPETGSREDDQHPGDCPAPRRSQLSGLGSESTPRLTPEGGLSTLGRAERRYLDLKATDTDNERPRAPRSSRRRERSQKSLESRTNSEYLARTSKRAFPRQYSTMSSSIRPKVQDDSEGNTVDAPAQNCKASSPLVEWSPAELQANTDSNAPDDSDTPALGNAEYKPRSPVRLGPLITRHSPAALLRVWRTIRRQHRPTVGSELISAIRERFPGFLPQSRAATNKVPYLSVMKVWGPIQAAAIRFWYNKSRTPRQIESMNSLVEYILQKRNTAPASLFRTIMVSLLPYLEGPQLKTLYVRVNDADQDISYATKLRFITCLSSRGETDFAFAVLQTMLAGGCDFLNERITKSVCAHLVKMNGRFSSHGLSDTQIFDFLVESGMTMNRGMYKALVRNSLEAGDPSNAWDVYRRMVADGLEPTAMICSLLLSDSKARVDHVALADITEDIRTRGIANVHLVTDILHWIYVLSAQRGAPSAGESPDSRTPFERMLAVYCSFFDLQPLSVIIPDFTSRYGHLVPGGDNKPKSLIRPPVPTLVVMLTAILNESTMSMKVAQYHRLRHLFLGGHPAVSDLKASTRIYNLFIDVLGRSAATLHLSVDIFRDMEASSQESIAQSDASDGVNPAVQEAVARVADATSSAHDHNSAEIPAPDVYTWVTLLNALLRNGEFEYARRVMDAIESTVGHDPVAWNNLVAAYAQLQLPLQTADAYSRMRAVGVEPDEITGYKIAKLTRYHKFLAAVEEYERYREEDTQQADPENLETGRGTEDPLEAALLDGLDGHWSIDKLPPGILPLDVALKELDPSPVEIRWGRPERVRLRRERVMPYLPRRRRFKGYNTTPRNYVTGGFPPAPRKVSHKYFKHTLTAQGQNT